MKACAEVCERMSNMESAAQALSESGQVLSAAAEAGSIADQSTNGPHDYAESRGLERDSALTGLLGLAQDDEADVSSPRTSRAPADTSAGRAQRTSGVSGGVTGTNEVAKLVDRSEVSPSRKDRLERNRTAAQQCRKRKKEYVSRIEEELTKLRASNLMLQSAVATAATENELLRRENEMYRRIVQNRGNTPAFKSETVSPASTVAANIPLLRSGPVVQLQEAHSSGAF